MSDQYDEEKFDYSPNKINSCPTVGTFPTFEISQSNGKNNCS